MDTDRLLKVVQEYFEHEYASYIGGATFLVGALAWFYVTDINRALKVSSIPHPVNKLLPYLFLLLAYRLSSRLPAKIGQTTDSWSTGRHPHHPFL